MNRSTKSLVLAVAGLLSLAALAGAVEATPLPVAQTAQTAQMAQEQLAAAEPAADCAPDPLAALPAPVVSAGKAVEGPACKLAPDAVPAALPAQTKSCIPGVNCTKHCACTCSRIKDCNVPSDCSNHRCYTGISCC